MTVGDALVAQKGKSAARYISNVMNAMIKMKAVIHVTEKVAAITARTILNLSNKVKRSKANEH